MNLASHREEEHQGIEAKVTDVENLKECSELKKSAAATLETVQNRKKRKNTGNKRKASKQKQSAVIKKREKTWTVHEIIYWKHNSVVIDGWNPVANAKKPSH